MGQTKKFWPKFPYTTVSKKRYYQLTSARNTMSFSYYPDHIHVKAITTSLVWPRQWYGILDENEFVV